MPNFDYRDVKGLIDLQGDSPAVQGYKAGAGAFQDALKHAGWSEEQIENGLRTHFESIAAVLVEHLHAEVDRTQYTDVFKVIARSLIDKIDPRANPCGRSYCGTCYPEHSS